MLDPIQPLEYETGLFKGTETGFRGNLGRENPDIPFGPGLSDYDANSRS